MVLNQWMQSMMKKKQVCACVTRCECACVTRCECACVTRCECACVTRCECACVCVTAYAGMCVCVHIHSECVYTFIQSVCTHSFRVCVHIHSECVYTFMQSMCAYVGVHTLPVCVCVCAFMQCVYNCVCWCRMHVTNLTVPGWTAGCGSLWPQHTQDVQLGGTQYSPVFRGVRVCVPHSVPYSLYIM